MPEPFQARYTPEQREALATAYEDRRIRPARRVVELAAAGELAPGLAPFEVLGGENTVRDFALKLRKRRAGEWTSELAKQPPRDAIESLRRRLVNVCDEMLHAIEQTPADKRDPERVRQAARAIREAAAIPGPTDPTPPRPGHRKDNDGVRREGVTRTSNPAGALLAAHRGDGTDPAINAQHEPAPETPSADGTLHGREHGSAANPTPPAPINATDDPTPGEWARAEIARQLAG